MIGPPPFSLSCLSIMSNILIQTTKCFINKVGKQSMWKHFAPGNDVLISFTEYDIFISTAYSFWEPWFIKRIKSLKKHQKNYTHSFWTWLGYLQ